jgi:hypothetical protein
MWRTLSVALLAAGVAAAQDRQSADVIVQALKVQTTKKNGDPWDVLGGAPDLKVTVRNKARGGATHSTKVKADTFEASFGERTVRVSVGDEIEVTVHDEDERLHDKVGEKTVKVTADTLKKKELKLDFDRVISLTLEFEP